MSTKKKNTSPITVFLVYIVLFLVCFNLLEGTKPEQEVEEEDTEIVVSIQRGTERIEVSLESYVEGVVASEMPASFELEALKAQAVASRSYVISRGLRVDDSTSSQVYKSDEELQKLFKGDYEKRMAKVREAVKATRGLVMYYDDVVINALFFSTSNGATINSQDYYANALPYLQAVSSEWDLEVNANAISEVTFSFEDIRQKLSCKGEIKIDVISRYDNHRVKLVKVNGKEYSGRELRELLGLRSTDFSVTKNKDSFTFKTIGFGHGVGMSQYGAQGMALEGYSYEDILKHYYKNVEIRKFS